MLITIEGTGSGPWKLFFTQDMQMVLLYRYDCGKEISGIFWEVLTQKVNSSICQSSSLPQYGEAMRNSPAT
jgi:hypothetical protein